MFKIEVDSSAVEKRINKMIGKIHHLKRVDVGAELSAWQTEDVTARGLSRFEIGARVPQRDGIQAAFAI